MSTAHVLTRERGAVFRAKVGDTICFDLALDGRCDWQVNNQSGDYESLPAIDLGFAGFRTIAGGLQSDADHSVFECLEPGKYAFAIRFIAAHPTNSSSGFPFSIYLEVTP